MKFTFRLKAAHCLSAMTLLAISLCAFAGNAEHANADANGDHLPGDSVYQLHPALVDQDGEPFKLADLRGRPVVVSMFYNSCQFVCPMLIDTVRATQDRLSAEERSRVTMLLVTFDPARDDVGVLKSVADKHQLDREHWTLARTDPAMVRKLAAVLHIQYKLLSNGDYNHSTALILLDDNGRILGQTSKLGGVDNEFLKLVQHAARDK